MALSYVGRFAPSPSGPLHAGSVATALGSWLHARQNGGRWLLRIDDIDPPRVVPGAIDAICALLERLQLTWDGDVILQSPRRDIHERTALALLQSGAAFRCNCSRRTLRASAAAGELGLHYAGHCRDRHLNDPDSAIRLRVDSQVVHFDDGLQGPQQANLSELIGDYVIFRRDALPAYHLACVLDDAEAGITDVVRGCDLLPASLVHTHLRRVLGLPQLRYWHLPVVCVQSGEKLAKEHGAPDVALQDVRVTALNALRHLGAEPPQELHGEKPEVLWSWALENWQIERLAGIRSQPL